MTAPLLKRLENWFADYSSAIIAFSGGVDSSLTAYLSRKFLGKDNTLAVIGRSASLKTKDLNEGIAFADRYDINHKVVDTDELNNPDYVRNPANRCFYCKSTLFSQLEDERKAAGFDVILGGENTDDYSDFRPGIQAARKFQVRGPLAACEISKAQVRELSKHFDLVCWNKPASPCLSSRIPYGSPVTIGKLNQVEKAEALLESLGFSVSRARHYGESCRIEVPRERVDDLKKIGDLGERLAGIGFSQFIIDDEGFISGKLNRALKTEKSVSNHVDPIPPPDGLTAAGIPRASRVASSGALPIDD